MRWNLGKIMILLWSICCLGACQGYEPVESAISSSLIAIQNVDEATTQKYFECNVFVCLFTGSIVTLLNIAVVKLSMTLLKDLF